MQSTALSRAVADDLDQRRARLESLFEAHGRAVFAFARRRSARHDADEVVSETFLVAWRRLDDVPDEPLPWLIGVARRCLANVSRSETRQSSLRTRLAAEVPPDAWHVEDNSDLSAAVHQGLARLSPGERDAITLLVWEELTPEEISVALGCTRAAVYLRLHRARRRLGKHLNSHLTQTPITTPRTDDD